MPILILVIAVIFGTFASDVRPEVASMMSPALPGSLAPSLATVADGRLVLTWLEPFEGGHALKFSVLDNDGFGPATTIAQGEGWFANWADTPGLFVLPGGDWVAHWLVKSGPSTYAYDVKLARSSDGGASWSTPISPHQDGTPTEHGFVSYFAASEDAVGVVWLDGRRMHQESEGEGAMTLRTARVGPDGSLSGPALLDPRVCDCCQTASALTTEGPVVVYRDRSEDEIRDHYVVRRTGGGWSEPRLLYPDNWRIGGCPVNGPAMIADGERVVVAWFTMPEDVPQVRIAISGDSGQTFELADTLGEATAQGRVDLAASERGFILSWSDRRDRSGILRLNAYDWRGRPRWQEQIEGVDAGRASGFPSLGMLHGCQPVVAWTGREDGERRVRVVRIGAHGACGDAPDS